MTRRASYLKDWQPIRRDPTHWNAARAAIHPPGVGKCKIEHDSVTLRRPMASKMLPLFHLRVLCYNLYGNAMSYTIGVGPDNLVYTNSNPLLNVLLKQRTSITNFYAAKPMLCCGYV